jgi:hypothetical protein
MTITPRELEDRFEEAALTLRRLPNPPGSGPKGYGNAWPEYIREAKHAYGYHEARMRITPSPRDIQRMEECIEWLGLVGPDEARIIWLRGERVRWRQVCIRMGCVRSTAWRRWAAALVTIAKQLNKNGKPSRRSVAPKRGADEGVPKPAPDGAEPLL